MHFAPPEASGLGYVISFAIAAVVVTFFAWVIRFSFHFFQLGMSFQRGYQALPSFHVRELWLRGTVFGVLWNIANIASMMSVQALGEGVGYSIIQANMLVAGMWGIFYFKEVQRVNTILKWFAAAVVTITGVLLLSYEHEK